MSVNSLSTPSNSSSFNDSARNLVDVYLNNTINTIIMSTFKKLTKKFSVKNIFLIICLLGIDNLKKKINEFIEILPSLIYNKFKYFKNKFQNYYKFNEKIKKETEFGICEYSFKNMVCNNENVDINDIPIYNLAINVNSDFDKILIEYIYLNENITTNFKKLNIKKELCGKNGYAYELDICDINVNFKSYNIQIITNYFIKYEENNKIITSIESFYEKKDDKIVLRRLFNKFNFSKEKLKYVVDIITNYIKFYSNNDKPKKYLNYVVNENSDLNKLKSVLYLGSEKQIMNKSRHKNGSPVFNKFYILNDIPDEYMDADFLASNIFTVIALLIQFYFEFHKDNVYKYDCHIFGYNNKTITEPITSSILTKEIQELYYIIFNDKFERYNYYLKLFKEPIDEQCKCIDVRRGEKEYELETHAFNYTIEYCKDDFKCIITENGNILGKDDAFNVFQDFTTFLHEKTYKSTNSDNITIYDIKLFVSEKVEQKHVPQHKITTKNDDDVEITKIIPEQPKIVKRVVDKVDLVKVNTLYKDFKTLYLKRDDEFKLKNILENFYKKKEIYKELGLQFKFGCLLYGPPGTGKTSAIKSIASFLKKNIFYLDLSKIKTNTELSMVYKRINDEINKSKGGVVVMEDIDCMTNIVFQREEVINNNYYNNDDNDDNDKLTLSHLLNILDGTLTHEEAVFIVTTNHVNKLDKALVRPGRFDIIIKLDHCDSYQFSIIYKEILKKELPKNLIDSLSKYKITPAHFIYGLLPYICCEEINDDVIVSSIINSLKN